MQPNLPDVDAIIEHALAEDIGSGDVTSGLLIPPAFHAEFAFVNREKLVVCGTRVAERVFSLLDKSIVVSVHTEDGKRVAPGTRMLTVRGPAGSILAGERVALNLLQRMCSVATVASHYVEAVKGTHAKILDTRKTMPGLRALDKYAVQTGGGVNHRMGLYDAILIKDNHISVCGGIRQALEKVLAGNKNNLPIEVECDTLDQVQEALAAGATRMLLDNMNLETLAQAVKLTSGRAKLEASGNVTLENVRAVAETGVDFISVGRLTHSVQAVDIGLDTVLEVAL